MLELRILPVGEYKANCYLLVAPVGQQGMLIDPGGEAERVLSFVGALQVTRILVTHGHPDHVGALDAVRQVLGAPVGIHAADAETYCLRSDFHLMEGDAFDLSGERLEVVHIPGHTPGSIALCLGEDGQPQLAIVGDAIFPGGPGHTETPQALVTSLASLARTVFTWADDTILYPGHGVPTTVGAEREAFEAFRDRSLPPDLCGDVTWY